MLGLVLNLLCFFYQCFIIMKDVYMCVFAARVAQRLKICGTLRLQHRQFDLS